MDIEYWDNGNRGGMGGMVREWEKLDTGPFRIKRCLPEQKYLDGLRIFTTILHLYAHGLRTIVKVNGKYLFWDSTDRCKLAAESWKLPFDLIVKFQHFPDDPTYKNAVAPIVPFTYTMSWYNMSLVEKYWKLRQEILQNKNFTSSMFWAGETGTNPNLRRGLMKHLEKMKYSAYKKRSYAKYFSELATTQVGVAVAGTGDFTHRDIELMSVGNAFVRKSFQNTTKNPRVPGIHYYSIGGHEVGIDNTMRHFSNYFEPGGKYRAFTDEEWDKHREMSYNARKWWEENGSPEGTFKLFREILEENNIV